jgi:urease accessory protein
MDRRKHAAVCTLILAALTLAAGSGAAEAHHVMGGRTPTTFMEGLLSGLGHPVIGLDHLAFMVALGVVVGVAGLSLLIPALFIVASALGVAAHVRGVTLPAAEILVALTVLGTGLIIARGRSVLASGWAALFAVAGLIHGYAFGESIYGAETSPLAAYLVGLAVIQAVLATAVALFARRFGAAALEPRLAGAAIAGIGLAILAGQVLPVG